ncbi:metal tolerance protein 4 [Prunus yedoensis var. nudiflora]|uniref:Metal tolerance protein 4 n=1 Tax=Prunus yedoensis var. nudiflora TaxID=2094558 RepID=A0A314YCL8_PRUYE|nr:metal tolerance protein 4 [Prunus yedoensis var. nudiflora]
MEGGLNHMIKTPLLSCEDERANKHGLVGSSNSVAAMKCDFLSKLPDKVRSGFDPEAPFHLNLSKTTGLIEGNSELSLGSWGKEYYEKQFATLRSFEEVDSLESPHVIYEEEDRKEQAQHERAMNISNWANIFLLAFNVIYSLCSFASILQIKWQGTSASQLSELSLRKSEKADLLLNKNEPTLYATPKSGSLAIAASTLDSLLDLMAGGILWFTHLSMKNINIYKYPIGKLRVQPVGIVIFAAVMATLGFQVLVQALEQLIKDKPSEKMTSENLILLYAIMLTATGKLWNTIVRTYAKDHYFDVVTNIVGLVAAVLGDKFCWRIDPVGAIILAFYTISNWSKTVLENAGLSLSLFPTRAKVSLVGQSAPPQVLQKLTYLILRHHSLIRRVDTVRAYTFGVLYFVELQCSTPVLSSPYQNFPLQKLVDIELPEDLPLKEAHAIGELLQIKIEELPEVERAFVHLDYECDHKPEHSVLSRLPSSHA